MGAVEVQPTPKPLNPATAATLKVSEIHYHPLSPSANEMAAGFTSADDFEFIELLNVSTVAIDLSGVELQRVLSFDPDNNELRSEGVDFVFASGQITRLDPGQHVLVVDNQSAFEFRYGDRLPVAGEWKGQLSDGSETITVISRGATYQVLHQFAYDDSWYPETDGLGPSLELADSSASDYSQRSAWRASADIGGSPGVSTDLVLIAGDANRDGIFDSTDLVQAFQFGLYETTQFATWASGDWDFDGLFDSSDLVLAFQQGNYQD